eukprot:4779609-Amphidinium_carterae.1
MPLHSQSSLHGALANQPAIELRSGCIWHKAPKVQIYKVQNAQNPKNSHIQDPFQGLAVAEEMASTSCNGVHGRDGVGQLGSCILAPLAFFLIRRTMREPQICGNLAAERWNASAL